MSHSLRPHGLQPSGSSIHGIFQARVLEWGATAFSLVIYEYKYICTHIYTHIFFGSLSPLPYYEFLKDRGYFTFFVVRSKLVQFRIHEINTY